MENQGFSQRGTSFAFSLPVRERKNAARLLSLKQTTHVSTYEYLPDGQTCPRFQSVLTLIITRVKCAAK